MVGHCCHVGSLPQHTIRRLPVTVSDENDNPPVFSRPVYTASITENNEPGAPIVQVRPLPFPLFPDAQFTLADPTRQNDRVASRVGWCESSRRQSARIWDNLNNLLTDRSRSAAFAMRTESRSPSDRLLLNSPVFSDFCRRQSEVVSNLIHIARPDATPKKLSLGDDIGDRLCFSHKT